MNMNSVGTLFERNSGREKERNIAVVKAWRGGNVQSHAALVHCSKQALLAEHRPGKLCLSTLCTIQALTKTQRACSSAVRELGHRSSPQLLETKPATAATVWIKASCLNSEPGTKGEILKRTLSTPLGGESYSVITEWHFHPLKYAKRLCKQPSKTYPLRNKFLSFSVETGDKGKYQHKGWTFFPKGMSMFGVLMMMASAVEHVNLKSLIGVQLGWDLVIAKVIA